MPVENAYRTKIVKFYHLLINKYRKMKIRQLKPTTAKLPKNEQVIGNDSNPKFHKSVKEDLNNTLKQWQKHSK